MKAAQQVVVILGVIGIPIGVWIQSGVVPTRLYFQTPRQKRHPAGACIYPSQEAMRISSSALSSFCGGLLPLKAWMPQAKILMASATRGKIPMRSPLL
ncbi:hypothetical protein [Desulfobacter vibrioformis]|uniref:hypothetical protein n=1 Tax=Desulfobacter vibrioformis TaxID=34031 RepID=UPI000552560D|nr:hypothetical protein [Desulfobacter vibrioformis]